MLYEAMVNLIGTPLLGFEPLYHVGAILILIWLLNSVFSILWAVLNWIGGK